MAKIVPKMFSHKLWSPADGSPTDNDLIVTDSHGDRKGLENLLTAAKFNPDKQRLFSIGDDIDRGNDSPGVVKLMDYFGAKHVDSNHGNKNYRYARHMVNEATTGKKNPMKLTAQLQDTISQFGPDYIKEALKMGSYPVYMPFEDSQGKGYLVHGGVDPFNEMEDQNPEKLLIRRMHPMPDHFMPEETPEHPLWQRSYTGHLGTIIHGHHPLPSPDYHGNPNVISLDGGGVFGSKVPWGGKHRAVRLGDRKIFEVPGSEEAAAHFNSLPPENDE